MLNINKKQPFFSIVIATYNSEKTLRYTLESIRNQDFDQDDLEILVVDGGSTDRTLQYAKDFGVIILNNPKRLPEYAKTIGTESANGLYIIRMDSDEEFSYKSQLRDKMTFLKRHPEIKMLMPNKIVSGRKDICGISSEYMNILGDPFSYFVYKTKEDKIATYKDNIIEQEENAVVMRFKEGDIYPLADSATSTLSLDYLKEVHGNDYNTIDFTCAAYDIVISETELCGCIKSDIIKHNCSSSFKVYLSKLRFRVINNLFHKKESGYSQKELHSADLKRRKILFCFYALLVPIPLIDSIRLAIKYRDLSFALHFIYLYYVCIEIFLLSIKKMLGRTVINENYGK